MASEVENVCPADEDTSFLDGTRAEAEAGSVQHQLFLGRHYTKLARADKDREANGMLGVDWLLKASAEGNKEATVLLRGCLKDKIGVTADNIDAITSFLKTSDLSKSIRLAARQLYRELVSGKAASESGCPKEDYVQCVKDFTTERREKKFLISTANKVRSANVVIEEEFVDTVMRRMQSGQIDPLQDEVEMSAFNEASLSRKLVKYPGAMATMVVDGAVEFITTDLVNLLMYLLPIDQLNVLILFFLFSLLSFSWLFSIVSLTICYLSFTMLVICTLQIFKNKQKQKEVMAMACMLQKYSGDVDVNAAENEFVMNSRKPYWTFLVTLIFFVPSFCLANKHWIPCSELALISMVIALFSIVYLSKHTDPIVVTSMGFDVLSCLPHLLAGFPNVPLVSHLVWILTVPLYRVKLLPSFYLNFSVPALEYAVLPLLFIRMAYHDKWHGVYKVLMPHLVGFFWLQIGVLYYDHSTWLGLARGSMGWVGFVLLFPFVTIAGTVYGVYYSFVTFNYMSILRVVVTLLLLLTPVLLGAWQGYGYSMGSLSLRGKSLRLKMAVIIIPLLLGGAGFLLMSFSESDAADEPPLLPWELYRERCGRPAWEKTNMAETQCVCEHYRFMEVNWTGTVEAVNITDIENPADSFLEYFPDEIAEWLKCLYGKRYEACDADKMSAVDFELCKLRVEYGHSCHMKDKRSFTFRLTVAMPLDEDAATQSVPLVAGNEFKDILFQLKEGHLVEFQGILEKRLGTNDPQIKLDGLKCKNCMLMLSEARSLVIDPMKQVRRAVLESISFFTSPLLEYELPAPRKRGQQSAAKELHPDVATEKPAITAPTDILDTTSVADGGHAPVDIRDGTESMPTDTAGT